ncbi:hypothetical protein Purlil1_12091 [Purpureocillium lilacinum]|uniref:Uncharacterized protein n=1 Tax=Purpureocillium lilacinum TaxID=33203 RepID=A0ABR0BHU9_PURLI|nr:hypothetical protein Purlil1_12091 [Purpureocillium lilacinum]
MSLVSHIFGCLRRRLLSSAPREKAVGTEKVATTVVTTLLQAGERGGKLTRDLDNAVSSIGWTGCLAYSVLRALEARLREDRGKMGPAMVRSYDNAVAAAKDEFCLLCELAQDHPWEEPGAVMGTVIALGVLVELAPVVVELLGFGAFGPKHGQSHYLQDCSGTLTKYLAGTFAARWELTCGAYVPPGSLYFFCQQLGMTWDHAERHLAVGCRKIQT